MLWQAARALKIDLARSYLIGDAATDMLAARRVGCRGFLVLTGRGAKQLEPAFQLTGGGFSVLPNLKEAVLQIMKTETGLQGDRRGWEPALAPAYQQRLCVQAANE
jgi:histidinol phosphatase-like enzyme